MNTLDQIKKDKIIAIIRAVPSDYMLQTAQALLNGGIHMMEITFDHTNESGIQETLRSIRLLAREFSNEILLGAGTVLTPDQVILAQNAGADYIISPNVDASVIKKTKDLSMVSIPGAFTPSEIVEAYHAGADIVKVFPAGQLGVDYIKAVRGPLAHIPISAVGGINDQNIVSFLQAGVCGVGIGGNLVNRNRVLNGDFQSITDTAKKLTQALHTYI